jgi:alpha-L-fucosidase 2
MISCSRPGGQPANLQGIWNNKLDPPWQSKWTTNINAEMNYWPVEITNLSECHEPFFKMIEEVSQSGAIVAKKHYNADGWVLHHNTDIWRGAAPINHSNHGIWPTGGAWISTHLWEHYRFTQDKEFLAEKYPIIKGAALFFSQVLVKDPKTGYLISSPSNSPEIGGLVAGPTMDHQLIRSLFRICIESSEILDIDKEFAAKLKDMIPKILPNQIGRLGQLQEWKEDKDDPEVKHRHVSHLWGMYPGHEINWKETPDLMKAARQSLEFRGDLATGWSLGWKINFWARFLDGNRTYKLITMLLSPAEDPVRKIGGGSYPNLFDSHPPFQIDGNFGGAAGIVEMLIQSHLETVDLLPSLPDALPEGRISGVVARGGFELSFSWKGGELQSVEVTSKAGKKCQLRYGNRKMDFDTERGKTYKFNGKLKKIS